MKKLKVVLITLFPALLLGCYPGDERTIDELDIVATDHDPEYFESNSPATYHMPDTVGKIGGLDGAFDLTREQMDFILDQVERNFEELGYQRIEDLSDANNLPDVVVTVNGLTVETIGIVCYPWYGWWYWYWWYPGWWGNGCYPAYGYSYTTGTLMIDMIVPGPVPAEAEYDRVWEAGLNGLLRSNQVGNQQFVKESIDQAFNQSPYL